MSEDQSTMVTQLTDPVIRALFHPRAADGHKGTFGHALLVAGSAGTLGAAILAAKAAMRTGCGLLTVHITQKGATPLLAHLPEAMILPRKKKNDTLDAQRYNATGIGPGMGVTTQSAHLLQHLLETYRKPLVLDADALTLLSQHPEWYRLLNPQTILTPHPKEFDRLTQAHATPEARFATQLQFSKNYQTIVVLKGRGTTITFPNGDAYRNTTGNSGMATAGSGDVLTGIITSLCAQGYEPRDAAVLGVYAHGFAGDRAAAHLSQTSLIASDIVAHLADFFLHYEASA